MEQVAFWNYIEVMNTLINSALVALPIIILSKVHMSRLRKLYVGLMFAIRITYDLLSRNHFENPDHHPESASPQFQSSSTGTAPTTTPILPFHSGPSPSALKQSNA